MSTFKDIFDAMKSGTVEDVQYFIEKQGVDVNTANENGATLLHLAAGACGDLEIVKYLISKGAEINSVTPGCTPLHLVAASPTGVKIINYLISKGADVNAKERNGFTPLHLAAHTNVNVDIFKCLVSQGAEVNAKGSGGLTPLHMAAVQNPNIEVLEYLISQGADLTAKDDQCGGTPLDCAGTEDKKKVLREAMQGK